MPHFIIVGLPDNAVKESQERVLSALNVNGYNVPVKKTVVNLAPADVRKEGSGFDLPMAIGLMMALEKLDFENPEQFMFIGELGLDGTILPVKGALPISIKARSMGLKALFVPVENAREAAVVDRLEVYGVHHICEDAIEFVIGSHHGVVLALCNLVISL
jgi:magnesium chelatase family protein